MKSPEEVRILGDKICAFLEDCGGPYENLQPEVVYNVFWSLGTGHYIWKEDEYFACYWCIRPEDVQDVRDRIKPLDIVHGTVMYVSEAASRVGFKDAIKALREQATGMKGVFWHRPAKQDKVYNFPSQRGE